MKAESTIRRYMQKLEKEMKGQGKRADDAWIAFHALRWVVEFSSIPLDILAPPDKGA